MKFDLGITQITESESLNIAKSQILSFIEINYEGALNKKAESKKYFDFDFLPEGSLVTNGWKTREIYDIHLDLIFRDHILDISTEEEIRVRVSANNALITPVWSVKAGVKLDFEEAKSTALAYIKSNLKDLTPVKLEGKVPLVCYSYPKMGVICNDERGNLSAVDIYDYSVIEQDLIGKSSEAEQVTMWSPMDMINTSSIGMYKETWKGIFESLPKYQATDLYQQVEKASGNVIENCIVNPELKIEGQETDVYCAVATAKMLLQHHGILVGQSELAFLMKTGSSGTSNPNQIEGIIVGSQYELNATFDRTATFEEGKNEILNNRPFKSAITGHARACGGYKIEKNGRVFLYIYDPWPPNKGEIYYEDWESEYHTNYIYVRPKMLG